MILDFQVRSEVGVLSGCEMYFPSLKSPDKTFLELAGCPGSWTGLFASSENVLEVSPNKK